MLEKYLDPGMVHRNVSGAIDHFDRLGNVMANDVVSPFAPMQVLNPEHSRRACTLVSSDAAVLVSDENSLRAMIEPRNGYTRTIVYAIGRRADKHIIDGLLGSVQVAAVAAGTGVITYTSLALPSARRKNIGGSTAWALVDIIGANELLSKSGVPQGLGERITLYSPGQVRDLMAITQASSSDFTKNQIHDRGTINGLVWEGFTWVEIPDVVSTDGTTVLGRMLPLGSAGAGARVVVHFHKSALGLAIGRPAGPPTIDVRVDLQSRPIQVRQAMMMAPCRVWEGGVVSNDVKEK